MKILRFSYFIVPILILTIFSVQLYHVQFHGLTRWRGGGFGMYTGVYPGRRTIWIELRFSDNTSFRLRRPVLEWFDSNFQSFPSEKHARDLLINWDNFRLKPNGEFYFANRGENMEDAKKIETYTYEVWEPAINVPEYSITYKLLKKWSIHNNKNI